ncbi:MAG: ROK family protein, partial [Bryobacteraceae bacterium]
DHGDDLTGLPAEQIAHVIAKEVAALASGGPIDAAGVGFPGIIREGVIQESPNLPQMKGVDMRRTLASALAGLNISAPVSLYNDADIMAAGMAATRGHLDRLIRVWTLGNGIGYGRYPWSEGVWEGGHSVVTLDPKEQHCGCGGHGHLEGIMGHRAMRMRFLDMEPDEVFENAKHGDQRCAEFVKLWHRALAAATATSIHMSGPGKFFITGHNAKYLDITLLNSSLHDMVKMSPLQDYNIEVVQGGDEIAVLGAAVNAERAAFAD